MKRQKEIQNRNNWWRISKRLQNKPSIQVYDVSYIDWLLSGIDPNNVDAEGISYTTDDVSMSMGLLSICIILWTTSDIQSFSAEG